MSAGDGRRITRPIILLGSGRSGTTLLGSIFAEHPEVAYWVEPRPIWMYGHAYRSHHELDAGDLTPRIGRFIDRRFGEFLARSGRTRFAEKTPSNCLRIPFIHALYPDCKMIHIIRDGRDVVDSTLKIQQGPPQMRRVWARVGETPLLEWPAYLPLFFQTVWRTKVLKKRSVFWGVRPPGWQAWLDQPPHVIAASQWRAVVGTARRHGRALPAGNYHEVRFERMVAEPAAVIRELFDFAELAESPETIEFAAGTISPGNVKSKATDRFGAEVLAEMERAMQPLLEELGYSS